MDEVIQGIELCIESMACFGGLLVLAVLALAVLLVLLWMIREGGSA